MTYLSPERRIAGADIVRVGDIEERAQVIILGPLDAIAISQLQRLALTEFVLHEQ